MEQSSKTKKICDDTNITAYSFSTFSNSNKIKNDENKPPLKQPRYTMFLKGRKNVDYSDNWSQEGKESYAENGKFQPL